MNIADLPVFFVTEVQSDPPRLIGHLRRWHWVGERHIAYLYPGANRLIEGRFHDVRRWGKRASFVPANPDSINDIKSGDAVPYLDGYWGERAAIVFDKSIHWQESAFHIHDEVHHYMGGRTEVEPNGCDHEHCFICWATISERQNQTYMTSDQVSSVCLDCFHNYIEPNNIDFVTPDNCQTRSTEIRPRTALIIISIPIVLASIVCAVNGEWWLACGVLALIPITVILIATLIVIGNFVGRFVLVPLLLAAGYCVYHVARWLLPRRAMQAISKLNRIEKLSPLAVFIVFTVGLLTVFGICVLISRDLAGVTGFFIGFGILVGIPACIGALVSKVQSRLRTKKTIAVNPGLRT